MINLYYDEELHRRSEARYNQEIGEERGKIKGMIDFILDFLEEKGYVPSKLQEHIHAQTDVKLLNAWGRYAAFCSSIPDFCDAIGFTGD